jgi:hypothetical protein
MPAKATSELFIRQPIGYTRCVPSDPIRFSPVSQIDWSPTTTSLPVHARLSIQGDAWIPAIPKSLPPLPRWEQPIATFSQFLDGLDHWERSLFADLTMEVDCYTFLDLVDSQVTDGDIAQLLTMSNGSDDSGAMTFGWIMALPTGKRLVRCAGPTFGSYGSSFRAEGYGFLSVSCFLVRLQEFCQVQPPWKILMMTDNEGLLTRITSSLPHSDPFPNSTLQAHWDVTNEIITSIRQLTLPPVLRHVKGHQDLHTAYASLRLEAQLNVDADVKASYYQCLHPEQRPIVPRLPSYRVQLHLAGKVITSKTKKRI